MGSRVVSRIGGRVVAAVLAVVAIAAAHVALVDRVVRTKSPTFDEPLHTLAAILVAREADHRLNPEDPPLLQWIASLPHRDASIVLRRDDPGWDALYDSNLWSNQLVSRVFWQTPGNDGLAMIAASRRVMLVVAGLLILTAAALAGCLAGPVAAVLAATLLALDPLLLGHGSLVKNDVLTAWVATLVAASAWSLARRLSIARVALAGVTLGLAMIAKFSGVLLVAGFAVALLIRGLARTPWLSVGGITLDTRGRRVAAAAGVLVAATPIVLAIVWASYGFRFDPTPTPGRSLSIPNVVMLMKTASLTHTLGRPPTPIEVATTPDPLLADAVRFAERHRLLPQAFLQGFLFTAQSAIRRPTFIDGIAYPAGAGWTYFPRALLYKLPVGTLALVALAAGVAAWRLSRRGPRGVTGTREGGADATATATTTDDAVATEAAIAGPAGSRGRRLDPVGLDPVGVACVASVGGVYLLAALASPIQLGVRHVLPAMTLGLVLVAAVLAGSLWRSRAMHAVVLVLIAALAAESLRAVPNSLAFFNAFVGGPRGGLERLSDSNLDWGQDLPALARWQRDHPGVPMSLVLFTTTDPLVYGIEGTHLAGSYWLAATPQSPRTPPRPGVVAVSATRLQGTYPFDEPHARFMQALRERTPREVLNGTIYLFDWP